MACKNDLLHVDFLSFPRDPGHEFLVFFSLLPFFACPYIFFSLCYYFTRQVCRDSRDYYGLSAATVRGWTRCAFVKFYFFYFFFSLFYFSFTRGGGGRRRKKPNAALLAQIEFLSYFTRIHTRANHRVPSTCSLTYVHENTYII